MVTLRMSAVARRREKGNMRRQRSFLVGRRQFPDTGERVAVEHGQPGERTAVTNPAGALRCIASFDVTDAAAEGGTPGNPEDGGVRSATQRNVLRCR